MSGDVDVTNPAIKAAGEEKKPAGIDFLDFVFTLAITVALSPGILNIQGYEGIAEEAWLKNGSWPTWQERFHLGVFTLCFLTLTLSWFGYHASIKDKPLKYEGVSGMLRFILDVGLVVVYAFLFLQFKNFDFVLVLLLFIHGLFVVWDVLKVKEHKDRFVIPEDGELYWRNFNWRKIRREVVTAFWFFAFLLLYLLSDILPPADHDWPSLVLAITFSVLYRANKLHEIGLDRLISNIDKKRHGAAGGWQK